jgi:hypothetical protein
MMRSIIFAFTLIGLINAANANEDIIEGNQGLTRTVSMGKKPNIGYFLFGKKEISVLSPDAPEFVPPFEKALATKGFTINPASTTRYTVFRQFFGKATDYTPQIQPELSVRSDSLATLLLLGIHLSAGSSFGLVNLGNPGAKDVVRVLEYTNQAYATTNKVPEQSLKTSDPVEIDAQQLLSYRICGLRNNNLVGCADVLTVSYGELPVEAMEQETLRGLLRLMELEG